MLLCSIIDVVRVDRAKKISASAPLSVQERDSETGGIQQRMQPLYSERNGPVLAMKGVGP